MGNSSCCGGGQPSRGPSSDEHNGYRESQMAFSDLGTSPTDIFRALEAEASQSHRSGAAAAAMSQPTVLSQQQGTASHHFLVTTNTIIPQLVVAIDNIFLQEPDQMIEDVQLLSLLGAGSFGVVYRGVYQGGDVAVKLVGTSRERMCWSEALVASQLRHPHVVHTYAVRGAVLSEEFIEKVFSAPPVAARQHPPDLLPTGPSGDGLGDPRKTTHARQGWRDVLLRCGATGGQCLLMLVQEHCDRGTLARAIKCGLFQPLKGVRTEMVARRMLVRTATEICRGMIHLHASSVIHGDLKPANVLLLSSQADRRGFLVKIADFGLARLLHQDSSYVESSTLGTVAYMSPEAFNRVHSKSADVYAFGMVLWEMVVGEKPYESMMLGQVMMGVSTNSLRPQWPQESWPELSALGRRCLDQDPAARPTFRELEEELVRMEETLRAESRCQSKESHRSNPGAESQQQDANLPSQELQEEPLNPQQPPGPPGSGAAVRQPTAGAGAGSLEAIVESSGPFRPGTPRGISSGADGPSSTRSPGPGPSCAGGRAVAPLPPHPLHPPHPQPQQWEAPPLLADEPSSPWTAMMAPEVVSLERGPGGPG